MPLEAGAPDPPEAGVTNGYKLPVWVLETELRNSTKTVGTLSQ